MNIYNCSCGECYRTVKDTERLDSCCDNCRCKSHCIKCEDKHKDKCCKCCCDKCHCKEDKCIICCEPECADEDD